MTYGPPVWCSQCVRGSCTFPQYKNSLEIWVLVLYKVVLHKTLSEIVCDTNILCFYFGDNGKLRVGATKNNSCIYGSSQKWARLKNKDIFNGLLIIKKAIISFLG